MRQSLTLMLKFPLQGDSSNVSREKHHEKNVFNEEEEISK